MPRQRIDLAGVVDRALALVDEVGLDELSLARVAEAMGVQAPALYNHVNGVDGLKQAVVSRSARNLADSLRDAAVGRSGSTALEAVATAYRAFARTHPGQYAATLLPLGGSLDSAVEPESDIVDVLGRILESYGLDDDRAIHAARIVRSAIHGFVALEAVDAFVRPQDPDESFRVLVAFVVRGMATAGREQAET